MASATTRAAAARIALRLAAPHPHLPRAGQHRCRQAARIRTRSKRWILVAGVIASSPAPAARKQVAQAVARTLQARDASCGCHSIRFRPDAGEAFQHLCALLPHHHGFGLIIQRVRGHQHRDTMARHHWSSSHSGQPAPWPECQCVGFSPVPCQNVMLNPKNRTPARHLLGFGPRSVTQAMINRQSNKSSGLGAVPADASMQHGHGIDPPETATATREKPVRPSKMPFKAEVSGQHPARLNSAWARFLASTARGNSVPTELKRGTGLFPLVQLVQRHAELQQAVRRTAALGIVLVGLKEVCAACLVIALHIECFTQLILGAACKAVIGILAQGIRGNLLLPRQTGGATGFLGVL